MTLEETAEQVALVLLAYPEYAAKLDSKQVGALTKLWAEELGDLPKASVAAALRVHRATSKWAPSIADVRSNALEMDRGSKRSGVDAWGDVLASVRRHGAYRQPGTDFQFPDLLVARCVASMSWQSLCSSENSVADRARFVELYDALATQDQRERQAPALAAATEKREQLASVTSLLPRLTGGTK